MTFFSLACSLLSAGALGFLSSSIVVSVGRVIGLIPLSEASYDLSRAEYLDVYGMVESRLEKALEPLQIGLLDVRMGE